MSKLESPAPNNFPVPIYLDAQTLHNTTEEELWTLLLEDLGFYTPQTIKTQCEQYQLTPKDLLLIHTKRATLTLKYIARMTAHSRNSMISLSKYIKHQNKTIHPTPPQQPQRTAIRKDKRKAVLKEIDKILEDT